MERRLFPLGDSAIVIEFGNEINEQARQMILAVCAFLEEYSFDGFIEYVPAFTTVTIFYDPLVSDYATIEVLMKEMLEELMEINEQPEIKVVEIPVLYGGINGPDLDFVAQNAKLSPLEVIALHTETEYLVHMIGFAPGFPYLGGMDERIAAPRKETPRTSVPAGSVGIAGRQTGIYPIETPGGWQIIGQTPINLFNIENDPPVLLKAGNKVRFISITQHEFEMINRRMNGY